MRLDAGPFTVSEAAAASELKVALVAHALGNCNKYLIKPKLPGL